jgi:hypothetical protein
MDANTSYLRENQAREEAADRKQDTIDALAADLFNEYMLSLAMRNMTGAHPWHMDPGFNCWDAVDDIPQAEFHDIGVAVSTGDALEVGNLVIKAVKEALQKRAKYDAEEALDND